MKTRWPALIVLAFSALAWATVLGLIRWGDAFGCSLFGQLAFGPVCVDAAAMTWLAIGSFLGFLVLWAVSSRPDDGHDAAPDKHDAAGDDGEVEGRLEQRR